MKMEKREIKPEDWISLAILLAVLLITLIAIIKMVWK